MTTNTGGPAFAVAELANIKWEGMTLRDYFAAKAMQGILCTPISSDIEDHAAVYLSEGLGFSDGMRGRVAAASYAMADAMLKAREA